MLREIGGAGQRRLLGARVAVVGAGGLGAALLPQLAAAGVGRIRLIDHDRVSLSNLQRQTLYTTADIGRLKVEAAAERLAALNPDCAVEPLALRLDAGNAQELLAGAEVVADGTDSFAARLAVADAAHALRLPLVSAAIGPFEGQLATFRGWEPGLPCYRCLVGAATDRPGRSCAEVGVLGALAAAMGSLQALEVIRELVGFGEGLAGRLLIHDGLTQRSRVIRLPKDPACPGCGPGAAGAAGAGEAVGPTAP